MTDLERALTELGALIDHPPTPSFAPRVIPRLAESQSRPPRRRVLIAVTVGLLMSSAGSVLAAVPATRKAVLEVFHLGQSVRVERVATLPELRGATGLKPGSLVSLAEAQKAASFELVIPDEIGAPDAVYLSTVITGGEVNYVYYARRGLADRNEKTVAVLVSQFSSESGRDLIRKQVDEATVVERLRVDGAESLWIEGEHVFLYQRGERGGASSRRLGGNVLIVQRAGVYVRIESSLDKAGTAEIARSLTSA